MPRTSYVITMILGVLVPNKQERVLCMILWMIGILNIRALVRHLEKSLLPKLMLFFPVGIYKNSFTIDE